MNSVETRNCGGCENFDRNGVDGKPTPTFESLVTEGLGYCRAFLGLSLGVRTEIGNCVHPELRNKPIPIAEVQPETVPA